MPPCFAPGCKSGYNSKKARSFRPSKGAAARWVSILKKIRSDTVFDPTKRNHALCDKHFNPLEIIKVDTFKIDGKIVELPRNKWKLQDGAVPTIFNNLPTSYRQLTSTTKRNRKVPVVDFVRSSSKSNKRKSCDKINSDEDYEELHNVDTNENDINNLLAPKSVTLSDSDITTMCSKNRTVVHSSKSKSNDKKSSGDEDEFEEPHIVDTNHVPNDNDAPSNSVTLSDITEMCSENRDWIATEKIVDNQKIFHLLLIESQSNKPCRITKDFMIQPTKKLEIFFGEANVTAYFMNPSLGIDTSAKTVKTIYDKIINSSLCGGIAGYAKSRNHSHEVHVLKNGKRFSTFCENVVPLNVKFCSSCCIASLTE